MYNSLFHSMYICMQQYPVRASKNVEVLMRIHSIYTWNLKHGMGGGDDWIEGF